MKMKVIGLVLATGLGLVLVLTAVSPAATSVNSMAAVTATAESAKATTTAGPAERRPQIREAIESLRRAKEHMEHAAHDFGGHRVEAIRATDVAIHQLEECLKYDRE